MSSTQAIKCDGCEKVMEHDLRPGGKTKRSKPYPLGWMRLYADGRRPSDSRLVRITSVDVCSAECTTLALKKVFQAFEEQST